MTHRLGARRLSAILTALATTMLSAGLPVVHDVDHEGHETHVEQGHGGHDPLVIVDAVRISTPHFGPTALPVLVAVTLAPEFTEAIVNLPVDEIPNAGRDPPRPLLPRGPPPQLA